MWSGGRYGMGWRWSAVTRGESSSTVSRRSATDRVSPTDRSPDREGSDTAHLVFVKRRRPLRWLSAIVSISLVAGLVIALVRNDSVDYAVIGEYLFDPAVVSGFWKTVVLTVLLMALAVVLGTILAAMRLSGEPVARSIAWTYTWFMRGVPVLVQMIFWFNIGILVSVVRLGIPGTDWELGAWDTNALMTPFLAALLGLGLAEAAYVAEIVRGGLLGVDKGQWEAASAIGMTSLQRFRHIIMPQAWRIIVPPVGNEFISMFKVTSLAAVVGVTELLGSARQISATNYKVFEMLIVASIWYLLSTTLLSILQFFLERRLGRSIRG